MLSAPWGISWLTGLRRCAFLSGLWVEVSESLRTGVWPTMSSMFLHYKLHEQTEVAAARRADTMGDAGDLEPITELDVLYGGEQVNPLPGFARIPTMITGGEDDTKAMRVGVKKGTRVGTSLAVRKKLARTCRR